MPTSPTPDCPAEELAATIETALRDSLPVWWQTPPRLDWAALAVARQLLGTSTGEPEPGCAMPGFVGCECDHVTGCQHPATATAAAPEPDTGLRDRIAAVLWPLTDWDGDELNAVAAADAVMPVLAAPPAPADRAAVLREAADFVGNDDTCDCGGCDSCVPNKLAAGLRALAADTAAGVQQTTTADRAAALGMTPTEYRQHSHTTAVQQIQAAAQGLFAGTAIRVADALKEPDENEAEPEPLTEEQLIRQHVTAVHLMGDQLASVESWLWERLADARDAATCPAAPAAPEERP